MQDCGFCQNSAVVSVSSDQLMVRKFEHGTCYHFLGMGRLDAWPVDAAAQSCALRDMTDQQRHRAWGNDGLYLWYVPLRTLVNGQSAARQETSLMPSNTGGEKDRTPSPHITAKACDLPKFLQGTLNHPIRELYTRGAGKFTLASPFIVLDFSVTIVRKMPRDS